MMALRSYRKYAAGASALALTALAAAPAWAQQAAEAAREYGHFPLVGSRVAVWVAAEVHLMFAAFVLGCPCSRWCAS